MSNSIYNIKGSLYLTKHNLDIVLVLKNYKDICNLINPGFSFAGNEIDYEEKILVLFPDLSIELIFTSNLKALS
tara:strand:- start:76 stop:297 length:222 start_codon:yes stop_codon:yes gene_type:complete